jgi:UDP-sulfoquinovose synthase
MHLAARGHEVIAVDNYLKRNLEKEVHAPPLVEMPLLDERSKIFKEETKLNIEVVEMDCAGLQAMDNLFAMHKPDAVVHYAEQPSGPYSMIGPNEASMTLHNNIGSTMAMIWAVIRNSPECNIVKLGTMGEYGTPNVDIEEGWLDVHHNGRSDKMLFPRAAGSLYHTTKILDTDLLWFYVRMNKLRVTDLMQGPVYGISTDETRFNRLLGTRFHYDDIFGTLLNRFVVQAVTGHPLTVYGAGGQTRGYLDIRDTMRCVELAIENPADYGELRIMNQFTEQFSVNEIAERVAYAGSHIGLDVRVESVENPRIEAENHYYNAKNIKLTDLGLEPHLLSDETIVGMLEYVQEHRGEIDGSTILPRVQW